MLKATANVSCTLAAYMRAACMPIPTHCTLSVTCPAAQDNGMFTDAESYCQRLMDVGGPANMRAKAILRDMRSSSNTAAAAAEGSSGGGSAAAAGGSSGRVALGPRRVLGDAGRGSVSGPPSWIAQALGEPRRQQPQQQQTPGQAPQQTPGSRLQLCSRCCALIHGSRLNVAKTKH